MRFGDGCSDYLTCQFVLTKIKTDEGGLRRGALYGHCRVLRRNLRDRRAELPSDPMSCLPHNDFCEHKPKDGVGTDDFT